MSKSARAGWYPTIYRADGAPYKFREVKEIIMDNTRDIGVYGGEVYAKNRAEARRLCEKRGIGEVLGHPAAFPHKKCGYTRPSEWMKIKRTPTAQIAHSFCWMSHLALASGVAEPWEVVGDEGCFHQWAHYRHFGGTKLARVIERTLEVENRIPGFVGPDL